MNFEIDRLVLSLHGITAEVAQSAIADLGQELKRRLSAGAREWIESDLGVVRIGPIEAAALDAAALRGLIAERIAVALGAPREEEKSEEKES